MNSHRSNTPAPMRALAIACLCSLAACSPGRLPVAGAAVHSGAAMAVNLPDFAALTRDTGVSVVQIDVVGTRQPGEGDGDQSPPAQDLEEQLDASPNQPGGRTLPASPVPTRGEGSGFVFGADGVIVTNAHVVRDADTVTVRLPDGREFPARVLGADLVTDVAVLKIAAHDLRRVRLGDPAQLHQGDWVLAIGSPFGLANTVTAGLVSALQRPLPGEPAVRFIQTDVPINPGSSGGPLFNSRGEVVGINSQIYSASGGYQGLSFAIPIDLAQQVALEIVATGHARHGALGVVAQDLDPDLASAFGLPRAAGGALLARIEEDGPAALAGLRTGDVVQSIDGQPLVTSADLSGVVAALHPGERVRLTLWRDGAAREVAVTLGDGSSEAAPRARDTPVRETATAGPEAAGLVLRPVPVDAKRRSEPGLLVAQATGRAARAGVRPGDILLAVNGRSVETPRAAVASLGAGTAALLLRRGDSQLYVALAATAAGS